MKNLLTVFALISTLLFSPYVCAQNGYASESLRKVVATFFGFSETRHFVLLNIKGYQQTEEYTCGPAAVMTLLNYYGVFSDAQMNKAMELKIAKEMGTSKAKGSSPQQIVTWLEKQGFEVKLGTNGTIAMLRENLARGIPTIVEWIDWGGHWVIVSGYNAVGHTYNEDKDTIIFANPAAHYENANIKFINGLTSFNAERFENMWFDAQYFDPGHIVKGVYIIAVPKKHVP